MADDVIAEEEESEKAETENSAVGSPDEDSKPTDRKLFKVPSQEMTSPTSASAQSYTWRIDLTKTEQVSSMHQILSHNVEMQVHFLMFGL